MASDITNAEAPLAPLVMQAVQAAVDASRHIADLHRVGALTDRQARQQLDALYRGLVGASPWTVHTAPENGLLTVAEPGHRMGAWQG